MAQYRSALPQLGGDLFLTDGGIETTLIFHDGLALPDFAAYDLLRRPEGEAEAAYNAKVSGSLSPVLIQQQYLARWDGRLPQYTFGGNAVPMIQIPGGGGDPARR